MVIVVAIELTAAVVAVAVVYSGSREEIVARDGTYSSSRRGPREAQFWARVLRPGGGHRRVRACVFVLCLVPSMYSAVAIIVWFVWRLFFLECTLSWIC